MVHTKLPIKKCEKSVWIDILKTELKNSRNVLIDSSQQFELSLA